MTPGSVVADHVSRHFRVYPTRHVTLKEAIVRRRHLRPVEVRAVEDVSLEIEPGESVGFMGRNGSGKTTFLRLIAGVYGPSSGKLTVEGRVGSLLELGAGFHPDFTGRENIYLSASIYGLKKQEVDRRLDEIIEFSELGKFIDLPIKTYSAGMHMRLGFSVATNVDADILLLDEVFAVGDEAFQRKCVDRILSFKQQGKTIAFVSHSGAAVERLCDRAVLLHQGRMEYDGETGEAIRRYQELLAGEENPEERAAGLREWGTGEARIGRVEIVDPDGAPRHDFVVDDPFVVRLSVNPKAAIDPPHLLIELRNADGVLLSRAERDLGDLGWSGRGETGIRFEVDRLPLVEGRFQLNVALTDATHSRRFHVIEKAAEFTVHPQEGASGVFALDGEWELDAGTATVVEAEA